MNNQIRILSSLEKLFPGHSPLPGPERTSFSMLQNDLLCFQVAVYLDGEDRIGRRKVGATLESSIKGRLSIQKVEAVPSMLPAYGTGDGNYLTGEPGLFPDLLLPLEDGSCYILTKGWSCFWVEIETDGDSLPGDFPVTVHIEEIPEFPAFSNARLSTTLQVEVINASLPPQELQCTQWFHGDCIADFYGWEVFDEDHWKAMEAQISLAARRGMNMILTPVFTPPLDTRVGGERTTIQLVDIKLEGSSYTFGFHRLERWIKMCQSCGIEYFEMAHLYTQWGAAHCPKIIATVDGETRRIFGWDTDAVSSEYLNFLKQFLPALTRKLEELGVGDKVVFHISDEPRKEHLEQYSLARKQVQPFLEGYPIMDALSNYEFYQQGVCKLPVVASNHVTPFIENHVTPLWVYYCCSQWEKVSNRFMSMPSARNRIIGTQFYKYRVAGFLHWGLNFYNSQYSLEHIDPFRVTDAVMAFPSGDSFAIYPGKNGIPYESIRLVVFYEALCDLRAFKLLEGLRGREFVMELLEGGLDEKITFFEYPKKDEYLLRLRERVNQAIKAALSKGPSTPQGFSSSR